MIKKILGYLKPNKYWFANYGVMALVLIILAVFAPFAQAEVGKDDAPIISVDTQSAFANAMVDYVQQDIISDGSRGDWEAWKVDRAKAEIPQSNIDDLAQEILSLEPYSGWAFKDWDANIRYRGIDHKETGILEDLLSQYYVKNALAVETLQETGFTDKELADFTSSFNRLYDKFISVYKELEFREQRLVKRVIHHTTYYIDLDGGNDGNDGLSTGNAWLTIEKYTTTTVRSAGDIAKVRANTSETVGAANIAFDEDGTAIAYIEIRGCSIADDPWGDASDVLPVIDFNGGAYYCNIAGVHYWRLYRLNVKNGSSTNGLIYNDGSFGTIFEALHIQDNTNSSGRGLYIRASSDGILVKDSAFDDNYDANLLCISSIARIENCTFDGGGTNSTNYGIYGQGSTIDCVDCVLGNTNAHDTADIISLASEICLRNTKLASSTEVVFVAGSWFSTVHSEDHDQVKGAQKSWYYQGMVERDSSVPLDSLDSAKMSPNSYNCAQFPLTLAGNPLQGDYQIWCPASEVTITIKARETAAWAVDPSSSEFYFVASYLDEAATSAHRATVTSAQGLSGTTEVSFTMTVTPSQAGWVYVTCYLTDYESGKYINVSVKPTIS